MIILARIVFVLGSLVTFDFFYGLVGLLLLSLFSLEKHPRIYRVGLFFLASSFLLCGRFLPDKCSLDCSSENCRNWTCPAFYGKRR